MTDTGQARTGRLHHLDDLRTLLVAWVIGGHALLGYSAVGGWPYDEVNEVTFAPAAELVLVAVIGPSGLFVIGAFFFVAGLLTEQAVDRHGRLRYARDRIVRLGLPWLVSAVLVWPASVWLASAAAGRDASFWYVLTHRDPLLDSGSLWFALVLMLYSVAFAMARPRVAGLRRRVATLTGARVTAAAVLIALSSFVVRLWFPARSGQVGDLHLWQWPQCAGMFALGVAAARTGWHRHVPDRLHRACGVVTLTALGLLPLLALALGLRDVGRDATPYLGGWRWEALTTAGAEALLVVAGSVWLVGLAERRLGGGGRRATGWAHGAFVAFVVQGPVLMAVASAARTLHVPAEVKAPLVAVVAIALCFWLGGLTSRAGPSNASRDRPEPATDGGEPRGPAPEPVAARPRTWVRSSCTPSPASGNGSGATAACGSEPAPRSGRRSGCAVSMSRRCPPSWSSARWRWSISSPTSPTSTGRPSRRRGHWRGRSSAPGATGSPRAGCAHPPVAGRAAARAAGHRDRRVHPAGPAAVTASRWARRAALPVAGLLLAYGAVALLPDLRRAAGGLVSMSPWVLAVAGVLEAASLATFSGISVMLLRPARTPRFAALLRIDLAVYGLTRLLPAAPATGGALRLRLLEGAGARRADALFAATVEGTGSALVLHLMLGIALLVSIPLHGKEPGYATAAAVGACLVACAAVVVRGLTRGSRRTRRAVRAVVSRVPRVDADDVDAALVREAEHLRDLGHDPGRWAGASAWAALNWLLDAAALWVVLAAAGFRADPLELFVAYAVAGVLGVLPITPGGVGVVEGVLVPALVAVGTPTGAAVVAVLAWRAISFWLPIPVGALCWLGLTFHRRGDGQGTTTARPSGRPERMSS